MRLQRDRPSKPGDINWERARRRGLVPCDRHCAGHQQPRRRTALGGEGASRGRHGVLRFELSQNLWKWGKPAPVMRELVKNIDIATPTKKTCRWRWASPQTWTFTRPARSRAIREADRAKVLAEYPNWKAVAITLRESKALTQRLVSLPQ